MKTLHDLFEATLKDVYYAESTILKALPKMIKAVKSDELKMAFSDHLEETKVHVTRLNAVFKLIDVTPEGKKCPVIEGLVKECEDVISEAKDDDVRDAGVLACGQAVEHYEIARYGSLLAWADQLGMADAVELLSATLDEEIAAGTGLNDLALSEINEAAPVADTDEEDEDATNMAEVKDDKPPMKPRKQAGSRA